MLGVDRTERWLALVHPDRGLVLVDLVADALRELWSAETIKLLGPPREVAFLEPSRQAVLTTADGLVHVVAMGAAEKASMFTGPLNAVLALATTPDARRLVGGHADGSVALWDMAARKARILAGPGGLEVRAVAIDG